MAARRSTRVRPISASWRSENLDLVKSEASHSSHVKRFVVFHSYGQIEDFAETSSKTRRTRLPSRATAHATTPTLFRRRSSVSIMPPSCLVYALRDFQR